MSSNNPYEGESRPQAYDPAAPLVPTGNLRRRRLVSRFAESGATAAAIAAIAVLGIILWSVVSKGAPAISWDFLTKGSPDGIAPAIVGTGLIVGMATAMAMPLGILIAIFVVEYAGRRSALFVKMTMDVMNGLPAIIVGLFAFALLVNHKTQSAFAGSLALGIIMVPLIARGTQEVLQLVPRNQREAADALGIARWRTVLTVVLPSALGGILTSTALSVARAAGETAPLILVSSIGSTEQIELNPAKAVANIPVRIFTLSEEASPTGFTEAWGASLVLISLILIISVTARTLLNRSKRKMSS